jgi:hypothetical protein
MTKTAAQEWLLIFYSVPSHPVSNRMKIWRKLSAAGAIQVKGAVYVLPYSEEHYEFFQWIITEVTAMGGDGAFVRVQTIETLKNDEVKDLFNRQREAEYGDLEKHLESLEQKISSIKKGTGLPSAKRLAEQVHKLARDFELIKKVDFFSSKAGAALRKRLRILESELKQVSGTEPRAVTTGVTLRRIEEYRGKTWVTRKRPFVDRMASAWLIRKFIDQKAAFKFIDEQEQEQLREGKIIFDMRGGHFTHQGDLCTFEVLLKAFGLKTKPLKKIAEIVHELDVKDGKYETPEASGLEGVLAGIRKAAKDDAFALEQGMAVFEMLYTSKS